MYQMSFQTLKMPHQTHRCYFKLLTFLTCWSLAFQVIGSSSSSSFSSTTFKTANRRNGSNSKASVVSTIQSRVDSVTNTIRNNVPLIPFQEKLSPFHNNGNRNTSEKNGRRGGLMRNQTVSSTLTTTKNLMIPLLRNLLVKPSMTSIGFGITCGIGYYLFLHPSPANAKEKTTTKNNILMRKFFLHNDYKNHHDDIYVERTELPFHIVVGRVFSFWKKVAPIIVHYKFATIWMKRVKDYDRIKRDEIYETLHQRYAPEAKEVVSELKGLFIKVGQVMSSRPDFMPSIYIDYFSELQDNVQAYATNEIKAIISSSINKNFNLTFQDVFEEFGETPLGSASIGQVHAATLTNEFWKMNVNNDSSYSGGREVAVKVMHVDAEDRFRNDFKILKWLCRVALPGWSPILPELEKQFMTEFDYRNEASNLQSVRENMLSSPYKRRVKVPEPLLSYSTKNVLIMEKLNGEKLVSSAERKLSEAFKGDEFLAKSLMDERRKAIMSGDIYGRSIQDELKLLQSCTAHHSPLSRLSILWQLGTIIWSQRRNVDLLLDVHGYQIFSNGKFNGDPHPGNILVLSNGQLGLIDYGQCYTLKNKDRLAFASLFQELGSDTDEIDTKMVASAMRNLGFTFKYQKEDIMTEMAKLLFDCDTARIKLGLPTPQELLMHLNSQDKMENVPDPAVFICRTSFLFRGMGTMIGMNIRTASRWRNHAVAALNSA